MISTIGWLTILFVLFILKVCVMQLLEDKKNYKERENEEKIFNQINKLD